MYNFVFGITEHARLHDCTIARYLRTCSTALISVSRIVATAHDVVLVITERARWLDLWARTTRLARNLNAT